MYWFSVVKNVWMFVFTQNIMLIKINIDPSPYYKRISGTSKMQVGEQKGLDKS